MSKNDDYIYEGDEITGTVKIRTMMCGVTCGEHGLPSYHGEVHGKKFPHGGVSTSEPLNYFLDDLAVYDGTELEIIVKVKKIGKLRKNPWIKQREKRMKKTA